MSGVILPVHHGLIRWLHIHQIFHRFIHLCDLFTLVIDLLLLGLDLCALVLNFFYQAGDVIHQFQGLRVGSFHLFIETLSQLGHFKIILTLIEINFLIENVGNLLLLTAVLFEFVIKSVNTKE